MKKLFKIKAMAYAGLFKPEIGMLVQIQNPDIMEHGYCGLISDIDMSMEYQYAIKNIHFENDYFQISELKPIQLAVITNSEKPKENTNTIIDGFNGDWYWNSKYNLLAQCGDITPYDFKIIGSYPNLNKTHKLSKEFVEQWCQNPVNAIEIDEKYQFEEDWPDQPRTYLYNLKTDELNASFPQPIKLDVNSLYEKFGESRLDLTKLEEKLNAALDSETPESLSDWLLNIRKNVRPSVLIENNTAVENSLRIILEEKIIKSDSARGYWLNEFKPLFYNAFTLNPNKYFEEWFKTILNK